MARQKKITDKDGFHIPVKSERSYAESVPPIGEQLPREDAAQTQQEEEKRSDNAAAKPVGKKEIAKMREKLREYVGSKAPYDERYKNNFDTYTLLYTENNRLRSGKEGETNEVIKNRRGAQTLKVILNKHADAMDNYPEAICLPRSKDDEETAKILNGVLPCVLARNGFKKTYSDALIDKFVGGMEIVSVTWDSDRDGGLGEVCIKRESVLNVFWQPFIDDIQESRYLFNVRMIDVDEAKEMYPQLKEIAADDMSIKEFKTYDSSNKNYGKAAVIDCYYKKDGVVHLCQFCGESLIFASENEPEKYPEGYYIDGKYPFVARPCFKLPDTPSGFGFIDICRAPQEYHDELRRDILKNIKVNSKTRSLKNANAQVNDEDLLDLDQEMIEVDGIPLDQAIRPLETKDIAPGALSMLGALDDEMKDTTGTNDASNGASAAGVTSGNAIAALQEAGGKISRDLNQMEFFGFVEICEMIIERMRQFYTPGRIFRIVGEDKKTEYVEFDGNALRPQPISVEGSSEEFWRLPVFDIDVKAQRSNPFTTAANNEMMINMFNMGMFSPQRVDEALVALEGMSFEGKDKMVDMLKQNKTLLDAVNELSQQLEMSNAMINEQEAQAAAIQPGVQPEMTAGGMNA